MLLGCCVSLIVSGRLTARLVAGSTIAWSFIPLFEVAAFAIVRRRLGRLGVCRTYVFATDTSAPAILEALRAKRTVVYGVDGRVYGDPALVRLAEADSRLRVRDAERADGGALVWLSRITGALGLLGVALL
ncbi:MAG: hypothetical protein HY048_11740 [Acidobacteria bacterium]|nr:hypothetical protein [Acidobacteriota bacterium]